MNMNITAKELAQKLNGREYRVEEEITEEESEQAKESGLVVIFGHSDDCVELRGAVFDELGAWNGVDFQIGPLGLVPHWNSDEHGQSEESAAEYFRIKSAGYCNVEAIWCPKHNESDEKHYASWAFKTDVPHETFDIMEEGEVFCRGIVLRLEDCKSAVSAK